MTPKTAKRTAKKSKTHAATTPAAVRPVGKNPPKADAWGKVSGATSYTDDLTAPGMIYGATVRSSISKGKIKAVRFPKGINWKKFTIVQAKDLPKRGKNVVKLIEDDQPYLADGKTEHKFEAVVLLAHPDPEELRAAVEAVGIEYEEEKAVIDYRKSKEVFKKYRIKKGSVRKGFKDADLVLEGTYEVPHQEQVYIETQGMIASVKKDGSIHVRGSLQCPYYVDQAVAQLFGVPRKKVRVEQVMTGGGFGGKEEYPSMLAGHAALLAWKSGKPVKMVYDREEDMQATTKRHPGTIKVKAGVKKNGELTALQIDFLLDAGAYATLSAVVLSRGTIHGAGPYKCPNTEIKARAVKTNTVPNGAFRGFGAPQSCFGIEMHMSRMAAALKMDPMKFREINMLKIGDTTATGHCLHESVSTGEVIAATKKLCKYDELRKKARAFNRKKGPYQYGIGIATFFHGAGFTGSGEVMLDSKADVELTGDGKVRVLAASTEIGQGSATIFAQMAGQALGLPAEAIEIAMPDTSMVPDSGPTVASRTTMVVGGLVYQAAQQLREEMTRVVGNGWKTPRQFQSKAKQYLKKAGPRKCQAGYQKPLDVSWDEETYTGAAYACYGWACFVAEVVVDMRTLETRIMRVTTAQDVGKAIHPILCAGQIEGGTLQALGYGLLEEAVFEDGEFKNANLTNYIIPTAIDSPPMKVKMIENPTMYSPLGAKGIGEMPMDGPAGALAAAVADATGIWPIRIPATPERLLELAKKQNVKLPG